MRQSHSSAFAAGLAVVLWLVFVMPAVSCSQNAASHDAPAGPSSPASGTLEQRTFTKINDYRASKGLSALVWSDVIAAQARRHSQDMAAGAVPLGHDGFADRMAVVRQTTAWRTASENVAMNLNERDPVAAAVEDWLNSAEHRANVEGNFDLTGIGAATAANGAVYLTQIFVRSR